MRALLFTAPLLLASVGSASNTTFEDLRKAYPGSMGWSRSGLSTACSSEDVWELEAFDFAQGSKLRISAKACKVALGVHESNVLWAVVFPEEPASIETDLPGGGERATTIFLRFAPTDLGQIFPKKTVGKRADPWLRHEAHRIFRHKLGWRWYTLGGNTTVVPSGFVIVDADTESGKRRFYGVDGSAGNTEYVTEFESDPVPALESIEPEDALSAFDEVWSAFDREYPLFGIGPKVNWTRLRKTYAPHAESATTVFGLASVLSEMLAKLENLHVWVQMGTDYLPGFQRDRPLNANWRASLKRLTGAQSAGEQLTWGRTSDGIGYVNVSGLSDPELSMHVDRALEDLSDTWGLVIDLRFNGGGDERLARGIAARFVDEERTYSKNRYRSGAKHSALGAPIDRTFAPRSWRYGAPVVALFGQRTLSSAESFALMLDRCPTVTTMGDRTGGSSANPRRLELDCGIQVNLPRWLDMAPDGNPIEHAGVPPDVRLEFDSSEFNDDSDPVLDAALARLRKTPKGKRKPGKP